jgi:predicted metallopeptidase
MKYDKAPQIKAEIEALVKLCGFSHINTSRVHCIRSYTAKTRAIARIWGMSKLFKEVANIEPHYIIEVNSKYFDKLPKREQLKTLIHELMHIPKTFSGALLSHKGRYHKINNSEVEKIVKKIESSESNNG